MKVLIIDDEELIRLNYSVFLEDQGYETDDAANGVEALEKIKSQSPDIMLLDLQMPIMDGFSVLKRLKELKKEIPVIVISGADKMEDVVYAHRIGAWEYIVKPIKDMETISLAIDKCLEKKQLNQKIIEYQKYLEKKVESKTEELNQNKEKFNKLFGLVQDSIFLVSLENHQIVQTNPQGNEIFKEALSKTLKIIDLFKNPNDYAYLSSQESIKNYQCRFSKDLTRFFPAEISSVKHFINDKPILVINIRDISHHVEYKNLIENQKAFFKNVIDSSPSPITVLNDKKELILANNQYFRFFQVQEKESYNKKESEILRGFFSPDALSKYEKETPSPKNVEIRSNWEFNIDNKTYNFLLIGKLITLPHEKKPFILNNWIDITSLKEAEQNILESKREAEKANLAKSKFLADISHEFRNPLNGIVGSLKLLREYEMDDEQKKLLSFARLSTDNLTWIINSMINYHYHDENADCNSDVLFNASSALHSILSLYRKNFANSQINLNITNELSPIKVYGKKNILEKLIIQLFINFTHFISQGEISITLREDQPVTSKIMDMQIMIHAGPMDSHFTFTRNESHNNLENTGLGFSMFNYLTTLLNGGINYELSEKSFVHININIPLKTE